MGYYKSLKEREYFFKYTKHEIEKTLAEFTPERSLEDCTNLTMKELDALVNAFCFKGEDITIRKFIAWLFRFGFRLEKLSGFERFWEKEKAAGKPGGQDTKE